MTQRQAGKLILIVEDHEMMRQAFGILLEESGYRVVQAANGRDAIAVAEAHIPDLILLDLGLPDMSGLNVARKLKANPATSNAPIVALTGRALKSDEAACRAAGCAEYLIKPVDFRHLLERVQKLV